MPKEPEPTSSKREPLTRDEALDLLRRLAEDDDFEVAHFRADMALLRLIDDAEVTEAFLAVGRYYA